MLKGALQELSDLDTAGLAMSSARKKHTTIIFLGSELHSWLLFFSLPVMRNIFPIAHYKNFSYLVASTHVLTGAKISIEDFNLAETWLTEFYKEFMELFGNYLECMVASQSHALSIV